MNFNELEQSRLVAEDHMKRARQVSETNRLLASTESTVMEKQPGKAGRLSLHHWFLFLRRRRQDPG
ncbi:MAG: hypothetical protein R6X18_00870 [Chloroflexota bacterium]|jgi:hypothetical protein